ncbi:hypothetical protein D5086_004488 [Populus alba]|uniref:Uncharacterized protein n=2 Tax=Populus TaxID=3689 RepID=A0ACC4CSQ3_POPAL|nr:hypothetical protein NC653_005557 [Populus alba x Populus x berolinensis]
MPEKFPFQLFDAWAWDQCIFNHFGLLAGLEVAGGCIFHNPKTSSGQRQGIRRYNSTHERNERILTRRLMAPGGRAFCLLFWRNEVTLKAETDQEFDS